MYSLHCNPYSYLFFKWLKVSNIHANLFNTDAMEKTSTIKFVRTFVFAALALICAVSCVKIDDESSAVAPEQPARPTVLLPTRSYEEALSLARKSIALVDRGQTRSATARSIRSERGQCITIPSTRSSESQADTLMYIFNFEGNDGFSIIAANRAVDPILAVAEKGNYTYGEATGVENFDFYMDAMVQSLADRKILPIDTVRTTPMFKQVEVNESYSRDPFISVRWGQESPYGNYCSNGKSGCAATAIAQIMTFYRFPSSITTTYTDAPHAGETIALDWDSMINYSYGYQISALMREIGQRVGMNYSNPNSSGASPDKVASCIRSFGYTCSEFANYNISTIHDNLDNWQPAYVIGYSILGGHAWIADGYIYSRIGTEYYEKRLVNNDEPGLIPHYEYVLTNSTVQTTNLVHYNWGWDGSCDGYFAPGNGVASGNGNIFNGLQMITSIKYEIGY